MLSGAPELNTIANPVPDAVPFERLRRILVIKLGHHGDVLLAAPVLSALKRAAPQAPIDALVHDDTAPMLEDHPALGALHLVGRRWREAGRWARLREERRLYGTLKAAGYDLLVHLSEQNRGAWLARRLGARWSVAAEREPARRFWSRSFSHLYPKLRGGRRHQVELNLDALRRIGLQPGPDREVIFVPGADAEAEVNRLLIDNGVALDQIVQVHPASRWRFKCWTVEGNAALIDRLSETGTKVLITGSDEPGERAMTDRILALVQTKPLDLRGRLSLKALGALSARARVFVGVDSMPMHLAAAMGTPTVALFGPSGDREWSPWGVAHRIVSSDHPCRPCGRDGCGGGKLSECLTSLTVGQVERAVRNLLVETRPASTRV